VEHVSDDSKTNFDFQLEQALEVSEKDVKDASAGVLNDLKRFQKDKEADLRRYMV
jgi:hypothetical protein